MTSAEVGLLDHGGSTYWAINECQVASLTGDTDNPEISVGACNSSASEAYVRRAYSCGTAGYVNEGHVSVDLGADYAFATGMTAICSGWVPSDMVVVEAGWKPYALTRMAPSPCQTRRQKKAWKKGFMTSPSRSTGVRVPAR